MLFEKIRAIAASRSGNRFAVAEWDRQIQIWDLQEGWVTSLDTDFVSGMADAISISADGSYLAIAGYDAHTSTLFDLRSGIAWQRKDLKKPSKMLIPEQCKGMVFLCTENEGSFLLDVQTGETRETLRGVKRIHENHYGTSDLLERSSSYILNNRITGKRSKPYPYQSFALLDACFTPQHLICAYATNPLEASRLADGKSIWKLHVKGHFLDIEYAPALNCILAIRWDYDEGGPKYLSYIDPETGALEKELNLGQHNELAFLRRGSLLLSSKGILFDTGLGKEVAKFDFEGQ